VKTNYHHQKPLVLRPIIDTEQTRSMGHKKRSSLNLKDLDGANQAAHNHQSRKNTLKKDDKDNKTVKWKSTSGNY
jgi:hypothetical protein